MKNLREHGIAVMTLTDLVDDFCLAQGNMREANILAQYRHARWAWKELYRTTLWYLRTAVLCVDCQTHTIRLPDDCDRVLTISVIDNEGKLHPLGFNTDFNTAQIKCVKVGCSCQVCGGEDTLCGAIDTISAVTETVMIKGNPYTKTILTKYSGNGAIQTETTTPSWDVRTGSIIDVVSYETICTVEVTEKGCIKPTQANMNALRIYCGCGNFIDQWSQFGYGWRGWERQRELLPAVYNYWGEWNYNAQDRSIIHIFGSCGAWQNHFNHTYDQEYQWRNNIKQVIVSYQSNGETPGTEILIPEYAVEAIESGIFYRQKKLNPRTSPADRMAAKNEWSVAKTDVVRYLNPINMDLIVKLQANARLW